MISTELLDIQEIGEDEAKQGTPVRPPRAARGMPIAYLFADGSFVWQTRQFGQKQYWRLRLLTATPTLPAQQTDQAT
jgi:hypothetical protein